jgi:hypothetical protein
VSHSICLLAQPGSLPPSSLPDAEQRSQSIVLYFQFLDRLSTRRSLSARDYSSIDDLRREVLRSTREVREGPPKVDILVR